MGKTKDLQPWLNYFAMLLAHERKGFLEVMPDRHEAYVALPALCVLCGADPGRLHELPMAAADAARRIRGYSAWKSGRDIGYTESPFAMHVVKDEPPHDPLFTVLVSRRRRWWAPWTKADAFDVIPYADSHG